MSIVQIPFNECRAESWRNAMAHRVPRDAVASDIASAAGSRLASLTAQAHENSQLDTIASRHGRKKTRSLGAG
jgi:tRNA A37 threonylcarbamoyladenosine synthetase subunit TsaC/SUA5/YrdC